jgi:tRNA(adenine34) deaminase
MSSDELFMTEAIKEAESAVQSGDFPIGCVLVINGKVVARSHNTGYSDKNRLAHAELKVLMESRELLEQHKGEATLYSTYEPCPMCFGALILMKISRVVCGIDIDHSGCLDMKAHLPAFWKQSKFNFQIKRGVLEEECKEVFKKGKMASEYNFE